MKLQAPLEISHLSVKLSLVMEFLTGQAWYIFILTVLIAGCASSNNNAKFSTAQQNTLNNPNNIDEAFADDDFDLLQEELDEQMVEIADPLEPLNRLMFNVNDVLYFWVAKPCA